MSFIQSIKYILSDVQLQISVNLTDLLVDTDPLNYLKYCKDNGISKLSFRKIAIPDNPANTKLSQDTIDWINKNANEEKYLPFVKRWNEYIRNYPVAKVLGFNNHARNVDGVSCMMFQYCMEEHFDKEREYHRTAILHEDGKMSLSWYGSDVQPIDF